MKKIIVIGCPGSGKSTFSLALHQKTQIPLFHLDMLFWKSDKSTLEKSVFRSKLLEILNGDEWIIDGNYASTMEARMYACDTVFFLDYPTDVCLEGIKLRRGKPRPDMPFTESDEDEEFTRFVSTFNECERPKIMKLLSIFKNKQIIIFNSRSEADEFLGKTQF